MSNTRISRRQLLAGTGGLAAVLASSACGLSAESGGDSTAQARVDASAKLSGTITFQTWSLKNDKFTPYFKSLVASFEKRHPGTTIKWVDQPGEGYEDKVQQQATANQLPDVLNLPPNFAWMLAKADKLMDLKAADPSVLSEYTAGGLDSYVFDDISGTYGYPWYLGTDLNWWNTGAFRKYGMDPTALPTTMDDLFAQALTMAKASKGKMPLVSALPGLVDIASAGVEVFTDGKFVFNSPKARQILDQYAKLYKAKAMPPEVLQNNYLGNSALFTQGKVAWTTGSSGFAVDLGKDAPEIKRTVAMTPRIGASPLYVQGISVAKTSKNPNLAVAFAQYVTNNTNQVEFVKVATGYFPGTRKANDNPESFTSGLDDPTMKKATELLAGHIKTAKMLQPIQFTDDMSTYLGQQLASAVRGDVTSQAALDKAATYCNQKLTK